MCSRMPPFSSTEFFPNHAPSAWFSLSIKSERRKYKKVWLAPEEFSLITFVVMQVPLTRLHSLCSMQRERSKRNTRGEYPPRPLCTALRQRAVEKHVGTRSAKRLQTHRLTAVQTRSLFVSPLREEIPSRATQKDSADAALAFSKILEPQKVVSASDLYGTIFGTQGVAAQPVNLTTTHTSHALPSST